MREGASVYAERIRAIVERHEFDKRGKKIKITVSIGVSSCTVDAMTIFDILEKADEVLFWRQRRRQK